MPQARYRAFRFHHPDLDAAEASAGLVVSPAGSLGMVQDLASVRQAILLLISTARGERVMRPDYGCDLDRLVFQPNDQTLAGLAIHYVGRALATWEPRIEVIRLDASAASPETLEIMIEYRLKADRGRRDVIVASFDLESAHLEAREYAAPPPPAPHAGHVVAPAPA